MGPYNALERRQAKTKANADEKRAARSRTQALPARKTGRYGLALGAGKCPGGGGSENCT
jgi:hypothetical protein